MDMYKLIILLPFFIFIKSTSGTLFEEEEEAKKYINHRDVIQVREKMNILQKGYGKSWVLMPSGNGTDYFAWLLSKRTRSGGRTLTPEITFDYLYDCMEFQLFTRENPEGEIIDPKNVSSCNFNRTKFTKIITHGWLSDANSSIVVNIRDAYLETQDLNVIGVDWNCVAKDYVYTNAAQSTSIVGKFIGQFIDSLVSEMNADYKKVHIIGHSLGAHVAGFAGDSTKERVARITGLDPALPGFQYISDLEGRLDPSDADFVDVIHTCSGILGVSILSGHADFYPNGGSPSQPGCSFSFFLFGGGMFRPCNKKQGTIKFQETCSHARAHEYFAESILSSQFKAVKCNDWNHFKSNKCEEDYIEMGENVPTTARGPYYLKTGSAAPFALDLDGIEF